MALELFSVSDYRKWGYLVKAWATGRPVPGSGGAAPAKPATLAELEQQCTAIGLSINIPSYLTNIRVLDGAKDTLTIRLPAKELVEAAEQEIAGSAEYELPIFYDDIDGPPPLPMDQQRKLDLQAERIGDYAVGMCQ